MASTNNVFDGVFESFMDNSAMEECSDSNSVNLDAPDSSESTFKANFYRKLVEYDEQHQGSHRKPWTSERISEVINDLKKAQGALSSGHRRTAMDYYWMNKYDYMTTANVDYLIFKRNAETAPTIIILPREQYFDILVEAHNSCGHGGRDKMLYDIKNRFYIPKKAVEIFVSLCPMCETKRNTPRKTVVAEPIVTCDFNSRGQVDIIDFQSCPDGEFNWVLKYQDQATKFLSLRPLKTNSSVEIASELMKVFLTFGVPNILRSDNGREFTANVIRELNSMWPECKIVDGHQHSQTQGSVERSNQDVGHMLRAWMDENKSKNWSVGCFFVQYSQNASFIPIIGRSPYKAVFGIEPKAGANRTYIAPTIHVTVKTEEQLEISIEEESADGTDTNNDDTDNNIETGMEKTDNLESKFTGACHDDATGAHESESYSNVVQATCEMTVGTERFNSRVVPVMCQGTQDTKQETDEAQGLKRAGEKIVDPFKKIPKLDIGNSVFVNIPKVDRGPLNIKHIQAKIVDIQNGVHKVATEYGTIKNWFSRQQLQYTDTEYDAEISDNLISLGEAVASQSPIVGPGFQKCSCKPAVNQCRNNRCACFKNKVLCGFKCHSSLTCVNIQ